jgi:hypothetical protein
MDNQVIPQDSFAAIKQIFSMIAHTEQDQKKQLVEQGSQIKDLSLLAQSCMSNIQSLIDHGNRISHDVGALKESMETESNAIKAQNVDILKRVAVLEKDGPSSSPDDTRMRKFAVNYLIRVGMDTRFGFMCAVPVLLRGNLYVAISLNLMATTVRSFFQSRQEGKTMMKIRAAFQSVPDENREVIALAQKVLAVKEKDVITASDARRWVVLRAEDFVKMCEDDLDDDDWVGTDKLVEKQKNETGCKGFIFIKQTNFVKDVGYNPATATKMNWGTRVSPKILATEPMKAYREMVIDKLGVNTRNGEHSEFTAHDVYGPRIRCGKSIQSHGLGASSKSPRVHAQPSKSPRDESSSDSSSSDEDEDEDEDGTKPNQKKRPMSNEDEMATYATTINNYGADSSVVEAMSKRLRIN